MNGSTDGYSAEQLMSLLEQMKDETEEKDRTIVQLQRQCEQKDGTIKFLQEQIEEIKADAWKTSLALEMKSQKLRTSEIEARSLRGQLREKEEEVSELRRRKKFGFFK